MEQPRDSRRNRDRWELDRVRYQIDMPMPPKRDFKSVADILGDVLDSFEQPVQESVLVLRESWPKLVGAQIAKHSEPGFIKDFTLTVFVDHPGWLPELERVKRPVLMKLQTNYRETRVRRLAFTLRN